VCTGNAVASGNVSTTNLVQDLDTSTGSGLVVLTQAGGVLNAGVGLANSGLNLAIGNISDNAADATQTSTINDALDPNDVVGPQVAHNGGGANNASDGAGLVGSGNAKATGNQSTTNFVQAADVDSDLAIATIAGGTTNTGLGLANSGLNLGIGNASTNRAHLIQNADGAGIVSNDGTADNNSDGTAKIGDPNCDVPGESTPTTPVPGTPGAASLPKTGGELEAEALVGMLLLLAGFGLRRKGQALA
jgi:LPXTG-motif cell wall-anchored protein